MQKIFSRFLKFLTRTDKKFFDIEAQENGFYFLCNKKRVGGGGRSPVQNN